MKEINLEEIHKQAWLNKFGDVENADEIYENHIETGIFSYHFDAMKEGIRQALQLASEEGLINVNNQYNQENSYVTSRDYLKKQNKYDGYSDDVVEIEINKESITNLINRVK